MEIYVFEILKVSCVLQIVLNSANVTTRFWQVLFLDQNMILIVIFVLYYWPTSCDCTVLTQLWLKCVWIIDRACLVASIRSFGVSQSTIKQLNWWIIYRACLVASIRSSGVSQSTIKLVATNLIANGKIKGKELCTVTALDKVQCIV
jgi:hypothetical protein